MCIAENNRADNWGDVQRGLTSAEFESIRHGANRKMHFWIPHDKTEVASITRALYDKLAVYECEADDPYQAPDRVLPPNFRDSIFIALVDGQPYLVNTEGYDYCRYILPVTIVE